MGYRYLGNKAQLAKNIVDFSSTLVPTGGTVADPMCGTASVSLEFARSGFSVIAADELTFPIMHARARLLWKRTPSFEHFGGYGAVLAYLNGLRPKRGFFFREYSAEGVPSNGTKPRRYFTGANAGRIDAIRQEVRKLRDLRCLTPREEHLLLHDLILATNRIANIAGTYGYFRSTWNQASLHRLVLRPTTFHPTSGKHRILQGRVEELARSIEADLCYLDPPYTKRQYAGNYHILETIAVGDEPPPVGEGGLRDWYDKYSNFCSRRFVRQSLVAVLSNLNVSHVLVSYSEDGLIPPREMRKILGDIAPTKRYEFRNKRFRSNGGKLGEVVEHLYHVKLAKRHA